MEGNCSEIKKLFAENDKTIVIDGEKKKQALEQIRTNMQGNASSVQKKQVADIKNPDLLHGQGHFIDASDGLYRICLTGKMAVLGAVFHNFCMCAGRAVLN